jgi:ribonuclease-3
VSPLEQRLHHAFATPALLREALTHPSLAHETRTNEPDNQRLEFLGDAVLQMLATEYLWTRSRGGDEGELTRRRAHLVNRDAMLALARALDLGPEIRMGRGEERAGGRAKSNILADAMESLIGAIHRDGGWSAAEHFAARVLHPFWRERDNQPQHATNPKGELQERLQSGGAEVPIYEVLSSEGPDHAKAFVVACTWRGERLAEGRGTSKKEAEINAAAAALQTLGPK